MTITTTAPTLSAAGISAPAFADILDYLKTQYRGIFGTDVYLENDSQDGQFLSIVASAINDSNAAAVAIFNSFSPTYAVGRGLSANVKLNGITRKTPTNSTANLLVVGVAGTAITNGIVQDANKNNWNLPALVNIPAAGQVVVTATCATAGAVSAPTGSISTIITPQLGWQSATNTGPALAGAPVESDATLRQRQAASVATPAQGPIIAVVGAVAGVAGVTRYAAYENPSPTVDANGLPPNSLAIVTEGGDALAIATAIANKKTIGTPTFGSVTQSVVDRYGVPRPIQFSPVARQRVTVTVTLRPISGYTDAIGAKMKAAMATHINALAIGMPVFVSRLFGPANMPRDPDGVTYEVLGLGAAIYPNAPAFVDVPIAFNQAAYCDPADVTIVLGS